MGWQSYTLPYRDDEHKKLILSVIKKHNEADWEEVEVGEELYSIVDAGIIDDGHSCPRHTYAGCILVCQFIVC